MVKVTDHGEDRLKEVLSARSEISKAILGRAPDLMLIALGSVLAAVEDFSTRAGVTDTEGLIRMGRELHADIVKEQQQANPRGGGAKANVQNEQTGEFTCDMCGRDIAGQVKVLPGKNQHACRNCMRAPPGHGTKQDATDYVVGQPVLWTYQQRSNGKRVDTTLKCTVNKVVNDYLMLLTPSGETKRARRDSVRPDPAAKRVEKRP